MPNDCCTFMVLLYSIIVITSQFPSYLSFGIAHRVYVSPYKIVTTSALCSRNFQNVKLKRQKAILSISLEEYFEQNQG